MAMTAAHQQICAIVACGRLFANSVAHFNTADALAAVQAVDAALDATLTQAVTAAGGGTTVINALAAQLPAPWSTGSVAEKVMIAVVVFEGRGGLI